VLGAPCSRGERRPRLLELHEQPLRALGLRDVRAREPVVRRVELEVLAVGQLDRVQGGAQLAGLAGLGRPEVVAVTAVSRGRRSTASWPSAAPGS
jgi:hypothetical protein